MKTITHITIANAVNLIAFRPTSVEDVVPLVVLSSIGGALSDLDGIDDSKQRITDTVLSSLFIIACTSLILLNEFIYLPSLVVLFFISMTGKRKKHRSFLHSLLCLAVLTIPIGFININYAIYFGIGMILHFIFDIFTIRKVKIFYPMDRGISLKLCCYNGKVNNILLILTSLVITIYMIINLCG